MKYAVFEDLESKKKITIVSDTPVKIHKATCHFYVNRKVDAPTVKWHGPFDTIGEAEAYAKQTGKPWKKAKDCL
jgi:hypothetical protein